MAKKRSNIVSDRENSNRSTHMFAQKETAPLFPCTVWHFSLSPEDGDRLNQEVLSAISSLKEANPAVCSTDFWQSRNDLQTLDEFRSFRTMIEAATNDVLQQIVVEHDSFLITGCWANVGPPGSEHPLHTHPNNYLSGVYYPQVPAGGDVIGFRDPRPETNIIAPHIEKKTEFNVRAVVLPVRPGSLLMFPSWFPHYVPPNQGDSERVSISFNIMFASYAETLSKPKWTFDPNLQ